LLVDRGIPGIGKEKGEEEKQQHTTTTSPDSVIKTKEFDSKSMEQ